jgi:phosphomevalonate kinase
MIKDLTDDQFIEIQNCCKNIFINNIEFKRICSFRTALKDDCIREYEIFKDTSTDIYYKVCINIHNWGDNVLIPLTKDELKEYDDYL